MLFCLTATHYHRSYDYTDPVTGTSFSLSSKCYVHINVAQLPQYIPACQRYLAIKSATAKTLATYVEEHQKRNLPLDGIFRWKIEAYQNAINECTTIEKHLARLIKLNPSQE